jgi:manganese/iron transport system permease protein/iron/zinc/copper transport system permease protein
MIVAVDLLEPFRYEFFRNGLEASVLAGALCGLLGVYVVLRGMSYIGHGLSHAVFGGAAFAAVVGVSFYLGAGLWGLVTGLLIARVASKRVISADAAIGVITVASFALGLALQNRYGQASRSIDAVLFGNVLGVFPRDVWAVALVGLVTVVVVVGWYRPLLFATFDPEVAVVSGVRVPLVEGVLMLLLSAAILVTVRVVGVLLISALLVIPAVISRLLTDRFPRMLLISPIIGAVTGFVGMYLSWYLDISSGAAIILVGAVAFVAVYLSAGTRRRRRVAGLDHGHGTDDPASLRVA